MIKFSRKAENVTVTFSLPAEECAAGCSVVGDFNEWVPGRHQMRRRSNGTWSTSVTLAAGSRVRFRYLGKNGHWFNDPEIGEFDGPKDEKWAMLVNLSLRDSAKLKIAFTDSAEKAQYVSPVDGSLKTTLQGPRIAEEFLALVEEYVARRFGS